MTHHGEADRRDRPPGRTGALVAGGAHSALAAIRSFGTHGIPVRFVGHDHPIPRYSRYLGGRHRYAGPLSPPAIGDLEAICDRERLNGWFLLPCADAEALLFADNAQRLERRFRLLTAPAGTLRLLNSKERLYAHAQSIGVPFPRVVDLGSAASELTFPLVIKPSTRRRTNAFTNAKAWRADSLERFATLYRHAVDVAGDDGVVVQELIPGDGKCQFSYAALWDGGVPLVSLVARRTRQYPVEFGVTSTFVETMENAEVEALAERLLASVSYRGLVEVEFKFDARDGRYKLLDVNTRPWTWMGLGEACGADFALGAWKLAQGEPVARVRASRRCAWMHLSRDAVAAAKSWRAGALSAGEYFGAFRKPIVFAAMRLADPLPGIMDIPVLIPRLIARRRRKKEIG